MADAADHDLARRIAADTGAFLLRLRDAHAHHRAPPDANRDANPTAPVPRLARGTRRQELKDAGDSGAQAVIAAALAAARPDDAVLSEEALDSVARLEAPRVWIIDPVDGTREFGEPPREDWAVHVCLWERAAGPDGDLTVGAVALPALGLVLATDDPPVLVPADGAPPRIVVSRTRPPRQAHLIAQALGGQLVGMGSAGAKAMAVVRGIAEVYVHDGGQHEWDSAAPVAVARAAGLHASRLDGSVLRYNRHDTYLPDLLICRPELAAAALDAAAGR